MRPATTFDSPQFPLMPDKEPRFYANVDNRLEFITAGGVLKEHPIIVPTQLFTMMKDVFKVPREDTVELYVHAEGEYYIFGMVWGEDNFADLWVFSESTLPRML